MSENPALQGLQDALIGVHKTARRRHMEGIRKYSHFEGTWEELSRLVKEKLLKGSYITGNYPGSLIVTFPPDKFCSMQGAEKDDKNGWIKPFAKEEVEVVLYSREALINRGSRPSTDAPYEIVSICA
jgi:hypothetical protein